VLTVRGLAVRGVAPFDLDLADGECVVLTGPSGSGKTLILRALADLDPCPGSVALDGRAREAMPAPAWRRKIAYVAAEPGWWADRVDDHFTDAAETRALLPALGLDAALLERPVAVASTGERQRLALIRALLGSPRVLLLDEPTAALDDGARAAVERLLADRLAAGVAILMVTHDTGQGGRLARRHARLAGGRLVVEPS